MSLFVKVNRPRTRSSVTTHWTMRRKKVQVGRASPNMNLRFPPTPARAIHVRASVAQYPLCEDLPSVAVPVLPGLVRPTFARLAWQRVGVVLGVTLSAAAFASGCSGGLPPGAVAVKPFGDCACGQTSTSNTYAKIDIADLHKFCPGVTCVGRPIDVVAYALCDGTHWSACDCEAPSGFQPFPCVGFDSGSVSSADRLDSSVPSDAPGIDGTPK
jgi:hypothetical protein